MNDNTPVQTPANIPEDSGSEQKGSDQKMSSKNRKPAKSGKSQSSGNSSCKSVALLSLLLSVATITAIAGAGWYGYQNIWPEISSGTLANQSWVEQQISTNTRSMERAVQQTTAQVGREFQNVSEQSGRLVARMDNLDRRLNRLQGADRNDWKLAEAEYLMRLANQRLLTMHDTRSAHTLLAQADELLVVVDEYGLFSVRQALAEDIATLRATPRIDISGTWLELNALSTRIDNLPIVSEALHMEETSPKALSTSTEKAASNHQTPATEDDLSDDLKNSILGKVATQLSSLGDDVVTGASEIATTFAGQFRIRENKINQSPAILSPEQEVYLRQNLRLMIEQAQVSLLQGRTEVYHASIVKTQAWLKQWFVNDSQEMIALQQTLDKLAGVSVKQPIPDISRSLVALKAYIDEKVEQKLPVESVKADGDQS